MASMHVLTLALVDRNQLFVKYLVPHVELRAYVLPLDLKIGNHEGQFDIGGVNFSRSARDIVLEGNILHAKLATSGGVWWEDHIAIDINVPKDPRREATLPIRFRRCELHLENYRNLRLIDGFLLAAEILNENGNYNESYLDLEKYIGIKNGAFDKRGIYFLSSVQDAQLSGTTLYATLKKTQQPISIELSNILRFKDGVMIPLKQTNPEDLENEILIDVFLTRHWLPNARNIRLLNYKQKRAWYLIAECLTSRGLYRESTIKLHEIIGPHDGEMFSFPSFSETKIPQHAQDTRLENGILKASFAVKDDKWIENSFDLAELISNEGGILSMQVRRGDACSSPKSYLIRADLLP
jgi:hypothetical protein